MPGKRMRQDASRKAIGRRSRTTIPPPRAVVDKVDYSPFWWCHPHAERRARDVSEPQRERAEGDWEGKGTIACPGAEAAHTIYLREVLSWWDSRSQRPLPRLLLPRYFPRDLENIWGYAG